MLYKVYLKMMMKLKKICNNSNIVCENFGYSGKHKHLPYLLKYSPHHIIYNDDKIRLVYFKPSYDARFIEFLGDELKAIRYWCGSIHKCLIFVYNYKINKFALLSRDDINEKFYRCRREGKSYLFDNQSIDWKDENASINLVGR